MENNTLNEQDNSKSISDVKIASVSQNKKKNTKYSQKKNKWKRVLNKKKVEWKEYNNIAFIGFKVWGML